MIELRRRQTKAERCELGEEGKCGIWGSVLPAAIGAVGSIIGSRSGDRDDEQQATQQQSTAMEWTPEQREYLFGGQAWSPQMPLFNPYAMNYAGGLMGGFNPGFGPQQPMGFGSLLGALGAPGMGMGGGMPPWYQDPSATSQAGGIAGLLGFGQGPAPPPLMNSPFFGHQVYQPNMLHGMPGGDLQAPPAPPVPQQTQPQAPPPPPQLSENVSPFLRPVHDWLAAQSLPAGNLQRWIEYQNQRAE